ncbi:MAG TPA: alpha/beta fold hydrolase, partial [Candidatus Binatia bacterium]|nr:alpha/beta fold hydrolase [Candidatus Binatia bacterium]
MASAARGLASCYPGPARIEETNARPIHDHARPAQRVPRRPEGRRLKVCPAGPAGARCPTLAALRRATGSVQDRVGDSGPAAARGRRTCRPERPRRQRPRQPRLPGPAGRAARRRVISRIILSHRRHGAGPSPVLLLHGFLGSGRNLGGLARRLAAGDPGLSVITLDLTGHGSSPPLPSGAHAAPGGADLAMLAGDVLATADALGLRAPVPIVGHSLGGRVALRAASRTASGSRKTRLPRALAPRSLRPTCATPARRGGPGIAHSV